MRALAAHRVLVARKKQVDHQARLERSLAKVKGEVATKHVECKAAVEAAYALLKGPDPAEAAKPPGPAPSQDPWSQAMAEVDAIIKVSEEDFGALEPAAKQAWVRTATECRQAVDEANKVRA